MLATSLSGRGIRYNVDSINDPGALMSEDRIIELEIKQAYQDDLIQTLNKVVADQQKQIGKLEETCKVLNEKIKSLAQSKQDIEIIDERPPHY